MKRDGRGYSREDILNIGQQPCVNKRSVAPDVWARILYLDIRKSARGIRGGTNIRRKISQQVSCRLSTPAKTILKNEVNHRNLIDIPIVNTRLLQVGYLNARSVVNKSLAIADFILDQDLDILCITETWLKDNGATSYCISELTPPGFSFIHVPRPSARGGGVGLVYRSTINVTQQDIGTYSSFENLSVVFTSGSKSYTIIIVYRPPSNKVTITKFLEDFVTSMEIPLLSKRHTTVIGDFNIHIDKPDNRNTCRFTDTLESLNLVQHITEPTHTSGHTLDLLITKATDFVPRISVSDYCISDHSAIFYSLETSAPALPKKSIKYRKIKSINIEALKDDIVQSSLQNAITNIYDPNAAVTIFNTTLSTILNDHAPLKNRIVTIRPTAPWYGEEIKTAKKQRRKAESIWRKSNLIIHREIYIQHRNTVNNLIYKAKKNFYQHKINENNDNQKTLFKFLNDILGQKQPSKLPDSESNEHLANNMSSFFVEKVNKINNELNTIKLHHKQHTHSEEKTVSDFNFSSLESTTELEVKEIVLSSASKSCELDPIPTHCLKDCIDELLPSITRIINLSLSNAIVPDAFKEAIIRPLLKKPNLDHNNFKNYRPISNLPFISKVLEKIVAKRLNNHTIAHNLIEPMQSAYKKDHSTETALLRIQNDILQAIDNKRCVLLVLLDLSAAFDTVDHSILLHRLHNRFGISGQPLSWFESYLTNRQQTVYINGAHSVPMPVTCSVPQGSVLGPTLFSDYVSPVCDIFNKHAVQYHQYADDTQVYVTFLPGELDTEMEAFSRLQCCLNEVRLWMALNNLKLNDDKTDFLILGTRQQLNKISQNSIDLGGYEIKANKTVKNLGATFDSHMSLETHVNQITKSAWFNLFRLSKIKQYLSIEQLKTAVHAFITSKLDNNNSLLCNLPKYMLLKLTRIQHAAARMIVGIRKHEHISGHLIQLHWLPIVHRINFKLLVLAFKARNNLAPRYLCDLITLHSSGRTLRSSNAALLQVPRVRTNAGQRTFAHAAAMLWNDLPLYIRTLDNLSSFKSNLKTHLFRVAYDV